MKEIEEKVMPVIPARNIVIFPKMILPMVIGRTKSVNAINKANDSDKLILCVAQRSADTETPTEKDIYPMGVICEIIQMLKMPDGTSRVLVQGIERAFVLDFIEDKKYFAAQIKLASFEVLEYNPENEDRKSVV